MQIKKIIIGVTQFGMPYGIMNKSNENRKKKLKEILKYARKKKIKFLYTSKYYGDSNKILNSENLNYFNIFTKFKSEDLLDEKFVLEFNKIKKNFKKKNLILILDGFEKLNFKKASKVYEILLNLKSKNSINKLGYSIYFFKNLKKICKNFKPNILQCPYSIIDRRIEHKKLPQYLKFNNIELHVRSIFLQGLLTNDPSRLPKKFLKWKKNFLIFKTSMSQQKITNLNGCLNFVQNNKYIKKILIGIDNLDQLKEIINIKSNKKIKFPNIFVRNKKLIDPSEW